MICASCEWHIPDAGMICPRCNPPEPREREQPLSYRELATSVRRLKGWLFASLIFGIFAAPFAIWIATRTLRRYAGTDIVDDATRRQLVLMRWIAIGLLLFWVVLLALEVLPL